jgi:hypothetical protein
MEGSGHDIFERIIPTFVGETEEDQENFSHDFLAEIRSWNFPNTKQDFHCCGETVRFHSTRILIMLGLSACLCYNRLQTILHDR